MQNPREQRVKVQLKVDKPFFGYPGSPDDYYVAVTGSGLQLGNNDVNKAPRCQPIGRNLWVKDIWPPKNSDINFKFLVVKRCNDAIVDIEHIGPRHLAVENKPIIVESRFNKPRISAKEIDELSSLVPTYNKKSDKRPFYNKAHLKAHLNARSQPKYSVPANTPQTMHKPMSAVTNKLNDGHTLILNKLETDMLKKQEAAELKPSKEPEESNNAVKTPFMANDTPLAKSDITSDTELTTPVITNNSARTTPVVTHDLALTTPLTSNGPAMTKSLMTEKADEDINLVIKHEELMQKQNRTRIAEMVQTHQDADDTRCIDIPSTSTKYSPRRKFLLAVAGVAAASFVGYHAFFKT